MINAFSVFYWKKVSLQSGSEGRGIESRRRQIFSLEIFKFFIHFQFDGPVPVVVRHSPNRNRRDDLIQIPSVGVRDGCEQKGANSIETARYPPFGSVWFIAFVQPCEFEPFKQLVRPRRNVLAPRHASLGLPVGVSIQI